MSAQGLNSLHRCLSHETTCLPSTTSNQACLKLTIITVSNIAHAREHNGHTASFVVLKPFACTGCLKEGIAQLAGMFGLLLLL